MGREGVKESLAVFDQADSLYKPAIRNAIPGSKNYDEVLVGLILMYPESGNRRLDLIG